MSLHIKTATGLQEISGNITKEKIIQTLGYVPANVNDLLDNIVDDGSGNLVITDDNGNIIMRVDAAGIHTTELNAEGVPVHATLVAHTNDTTLHVSTAEKAAWNNKSDFSGSYSDLRDAPNIEETESGDMMIADNNGNIIMKVDQKGLETTSVVATTMIVDGIDVKSALESCGIAPDFSDIKDYVDDEIAKLVNSAPETLDTLGELATAFADNQDMIETLDAAITNKADKADIMPADWNQNDENAADYVKNRTHWVDGETVHQLDEKFIPDTIARTEHIHNNYGVCSTGASTAAKTVQIDGFELREGAAVYVKFTNSNSASNPTLNVSGTGAKPMYRYGTTVMSTGTTTTGWSAGAVQVFIYDGTGWVRDYWNNSTYSNASLGQGYGTCSTAAATVAKTAALSSYAISTGGIVAIKFSNDVCANATLNVNSKGAKPIYYRGAAITDGVIKAGDIATFIYSTNYHLISIDSPSASVDAIGKVGSEEFSTIFNDLTNNTATEAYAHAQNFKTTASGYASHAEGIQTTASGYAAHAQGVSTTAKGTHSHAEGYGTLAQGPMSHAEGEGTIATGESQHVSGAYNIEDDTSLVIVGNGTAETSRSNAYKLAKNGNGYYAGDVFVGAESKKLATEDSVLLKTAQTLTDTEIEQVHANLKSAGRSLGGKIVTVDGTQYTASATAEIFGDYTSNIAVGDWSIAEGSGSIAKGRASHVEGAYGKALQDGCHVEGYSCTASGYWSHAEGEMTIVSSYASHAEGSYCTLPNGTKRYGTASGYASHIEGGGCLATGSCSHAEGLATTVSGAQSHAEGRYTIAAGGAQHVEGIANIEDAEGKYIHIAGNGSFDAPSNAYTLDWDGNGWYAGSVEASAIILTSPNGTRFRITVTDAGELTTSAI